MWAVVRHYSEQVTLPLHHIYHLNLWSSVSPLVSHLWLCSFYKINSGEACRIQLNKSVAQTPPSGLAWEWLIIRWFYQFLWTF